MFATKKAAMRREAMAKNSILKCRSKSFAALTRDLDRAQPRPWAEVATHTIWDRKSTNKPVSIALAKRSLMMFQTGND